MFGSPIRDGMQVLGIDGALLGTVVGQDAETLRLRSATGASGIHILPLTWIARVDEHVHLDRTAPLARDTWRTERAAAAPSAADRGLGPLWWLLSAFLLALLVFGLVWSCSDEGGDLAAPRERAAAPASALPAERHLPTTPLAREVAAHLASASPGARLFTFRDVNFDTESVRLRPEHRAETAELAALLRAYPDSRLRIVGYADARGDAAANEALGFGRAEAVAAALVEGGVDPGRIEVASGGEAAPEASNATGRGRLRNRRTELEILAPG